jgi:hypothetical protein
VQGDSGSKYQHQLGNGEKAGSSDPAFFIFDVSHYELEYLLNLENNASGKNDL